MRLLWDSHVLLWWEAQSPRLGPNARALIENPSNTVFVSPASIYELEIKVRRGKVVFEGAVGRAVAINGFIELAITHALAEKAAHLDWSHLDAFDRLLVAHAIADDLVLLTVDQTILAESWFARIDATR